MGKRKTVWPTDREIRLRFILFAVIDAASVQGVTAELLLPAHKLLRDSPTEAQLLGTLGEILATDEMHGFRFPLGSEAEELMRTLEKTVR
ncbi:hypothetical protein PUN49_26625 [Pseudomonas extremaustralis]|uniref:Uncharacterized protein n=1 Tax=Pseudomonas extremaustralis TaxID=359110 RepID=A0A5C5Q1J9_9PSED|nr:hypothetical protein [Pseudomonas extremaustralis]EZI24014.1 hypothetical protein PE143B_0129035 [Pseudomonas extremaustralis 14-3 substr. 14-3b]MDB1113254.1 hypothetical protein [Pseudomonas extremaustralis]MDF3135303.1 hypothetical protein [Pseudomonas extremaustralis]MDG2970577.1 hypothetical protein [Pseudomonas extremaustralis]TWR98188.1 hypothetical protein FIV36_29785 [Pseudomonas extremaustralis]